MLKNYHKKLEEKGGVYLRLKARPNAGRTKITEIIDGSEGQTVKIDVAAPPVKGRANQEIIKFLAKEFAVLKENVKIISGAAEKIKLIKIFK